MSKSGQVDRRVVESVRKALIERKGRWKPLPKQARGAFTYRWVAAFAAGEIRDPAYTKVAALGRCLGLDIGVREPQKVVEVELEG